MVDARESLARSIVRVTGLTPVSISTDLFSMRMRVTVAGRTADMDMTDAEAYEHILAIRGRMHADEALLELLRSRGLVD